MRAIADGVYWLTLGIGNAYVLQGSQGLLLIDSGAPGSLAKLGQSLNSKGWAIDHIRHILITHAHYDHVGDLARIQKASGAQVHTHTLEAPILSGQKPPQLPPDWALRPVDRWIRRFSSNHQEAAPVHSTFESSQTLENLLPGLASVHLPGHSAGHSGFLWRGVLFGGDVMMGVLPWPRLTLPLPAFTLDMAQAKRSLLTVQTLQPSILALGHGTPLANPQRAINQLISRVG